MMTAAGGNDGWGDDDDKYIVLWCLGVMPQQNFAGPMLKVTRGDSRWVIQG